MMRWDPIPLPKLELNISGAHPTFILSVESTPIHGGPTIEYRFVGLTGGAPESLRSRFLCYWILAQLPEEALKETMESLRDTFEFYQYPRLRLQALSVHNAKVARRGVRYDRPNFILPEE